ncbi:MAG: hypothetical protein V4565_01925 [Bacteroidota bacterium]
MKNLIVLAISVAIWQLAAKYVNTNTLNYVKKMVPDLKSFVPEIKNIKIKQLVS